MGRLAKLLRRLTKRRTDWSTATLRRATELDASSVAALLVDAYRAWTKLGLNPKAATYTPDQVLTDLTEKEVWLLEHERRLVGTASLRAWGAGAGRYLKVTHLATPTALHDQGLGSEVMKRVERIACERGIGEVRLDTAVLKTDLVAFYERRGYVAFGQIFTWPDTNYESQNFRKVLTLEPSHKVAEEDDMTPQTSRRPAIAKFTAETAIAVPAPQVFPFGDGLVVTVTNWTESDIAGERHRGLLVEVALDAANTDEAVRAGLGPAGVIVSMMSFGHAAAVGPLRPLIAYAERTDGGCDVTQHAQWPIEPSSRRLLKKERMGPLVARMNTVPGDERDRVLRGLDWYRKALTETNVFDRFAAIWIGLESINPVLIKRRDLPTKQTIRTCENCGAPVVTMDTIAGITDLLQRRFGEQDQRIVRRFRQDFMHSTRALNAIVDDAAASAKTALAALRIGLLELLNATTEEIEELAPSPMRLPERNRIRYDYRARPLRIATIPPGQATPRIAMRRFVSERTQDERGRTHEHIVHELETLDFGGEIPSPLAMWVAIPSADPDDPDRGVQMTSVAIVSKETGEAIDGTITPITDDHVE